MENENSLRLLAVAHQEVGLVILDHTVQFGETCIILKGHSYPKKTST